jgi:septal ring factor EnvC (AmiA/AmiB activator)
MRYIISLILALVSLAGFTVVSTPAGAVATVSGETRITSPAKPKAVLKSKLTKSQKTKLQKEIAQLELDIAIYSANISDIKTKITARKKAGITDNADLEAKMKTLKKALLQMKKDLEALTKNLEYISAKF